MRQMSLRAFRDQTVDLREPVEVSRRDGQGNIQVLGYWTPYAQHTPGPSPIEPWKPGDPPPTATISVRSAEGVTVVPPVTLEIPFDEEVAPPAPRLISSPEEVAAVVRPNPVRAVPKPSQKSRRWPSSQPRSRSGGPTDDRA